MYDEFYTKASELMSRGEPFATAVVVRAENPTSGKPGDKAIITADGTMYGWIGGSCAQPTVVREALRVLQTDAPQLIRLSPDPSGQAPRRGLIDVAMTCFSGGTIEIFIEAQQPRPRLLVVGALPAARALASLGHAMNYHVLVVDPEGHGEAIPGAAEVLPSLDGVAGRVTPLTSVVVASHGQYDEAALELLLRSGAGYIGLVASRRRAEGVREYLALQGFSHEELERLRTPAGLDIGGRRGDEIALSIMAEIVQQRRTAPGVPAVTTPAPAAATASTTTLHEVAAPVPSDAEPATAIDPICQMVVTIAGARHTYDHGGERYYFCCPGCKTAFVKSLVSA